MIVEVRSGAGGAPLCPLPRAHVAHCTQGLSLHTHIYMHACTHTHMYLHVSTRSHTCAHACLYTCLRTLIHIHTCEHTLIHTHIDICMHTYSPTHAHTLLLIHTYAHTCTYTHMHTLSHICIYTRACTTLLHTCKHTHVHTLVHMHAHSLCHTYSYSYTYMHTLTPHTQLFIQTLLLTCTQRYTQPDPGPPLHNCLKVPTDISCSLGAQTSGERFKGIQYCDRPIICLRPLMWVLHNTSSGCLCACSVVYNSLQPHGLLPTRLLCPGDFPGKNTGVGCCFLLQGIFSSEIEPTSPALQADSLPLNHQGRLSSD